MIHEVGNFRTHLSVAVLPLLGIFELRNQSNSEIIITGGLEEKFLNMLSQYLKFSYTVKVPGDLEWGRRKKNGSWTGLIGMIQRSEADMAISRIGVTEERMLVTHLSYPYYSEEVTFAKKWPDPLSMRAAFIRPFSQFLWLGICISLITIPIVFKFLLKSRCSGSKLALVVFGSLLNQASGIRTYFLRDKFLVLSFYIATFFITTCYISTLLSYLTLPLMKDDIRNIRELSRAVKMRSVKCSTMKGTFIPDRLSNSKEEIIRIIGESISEEILIVPSKEAVEHFMEKEGVLIATEDDIKVLIDDVFIAQDSFFSLISTVVVSKKFRWKRKLDTIIHRLWSSGLYKKSLQDYSPKLKTSTEKTAKVRQLKMEDLLGVFFILLFGLVISILVYFWEMCSYMLKSRQ